VSSFTFLHTADIHLDSPLKGLARYEGVPAEDIRRAPRAAFDKLIAEAIARRVDFVVIAGDLYDGDWKDMGTGLYFSAAMGRLARAGIPVFLLAGNHDAASNLTKSLPLPDGVHTFTTRRAQTHLLPALNVAIHGRSFGERVVTENLAATYPAAVPGHFNIGMLHTALAGHAAHEPYAPCTAEELAARGYDYWALGHVHEHAVISTAPHIVFPGNIQGRHIREAGPRGAVLVHVNDGAIRTERLIVDVARWAHLEIDVQAAASIEELHAQVRDRLRAARSEQAEDRPLIVRLSLHGHTGLHAALQETATLRDDLRAIAAEVASDLWLEKIRLRTAPPAAAAQAVDMSDLTQLLAAPDDTLRKALADDLTKFLGGIEPTDEESLLCQSKTGAWEALLEQARAGLLLRLAG
jgi:DNA repair exonuclease SbcCD nuclease subunit